MGSSDNPLPQVNDVSLVDQRNWSERRKNVVDASNTSRIKREQKKGGAVVQIG
jgi:hypothetical protein